MTDQEKKLECYREENKCAVHRQVVLTGSSLMEMFPINKLLKKNGDKTIVYNRGVGGFLSHQLLEFIDVCAIDLQPSKVFINIGTNDLSWPDLPICQLMENYDKIITAIENNVPDVTIYLMAYYPVNYEAAADPMKECLKIRTNEKISAANLEVQKLALQHSQPYIDINNKLKDSLGRLKAEYTIEGLHINEAGYRAIYPDLIKYITLQPTT